MDFPTNGEWQVFIPWIGLLSVFSDTLGPTRRYTVGRWGEYIPRPPFLLILPLTTPVYLLLVPHMCHIDPPTYWCISASTGPRTWPKRVQILQWAPLSVHTYLVGPYVPENPDSGGFKDRITYNIDNKKIDKDHHLGTVISALVPDPGTASLWYQTAESCFYRP